MKSIIIFYKIFILIYLLFSKNVSFAYNEISLGIALGKGIMENVSGLHTPVTGNPGNNIKGLVLDDDRPLKIINAPENISAAIMRLQAFDNRFLYIVKYLDKDISKYLNESQEAINFYYTVEERSTGIKISFAIIYIIIVTFV